MSRRGAAVAVLAVIAGVLAGTSPAFALRQRVLAHVEANASTAGPRLPASFLGLSVDFNLIHQFLALPYTRGVANPTFVALVRNLAAFGSTPTMRFGGGSTDETYLKSAGKPLPGQNIAVTAGMLREMAAYHLASGSPLIVGVNLAQNRPDLAAKFVRAVVATQPPGSVRDFEIGNEPDFYSRRPFYQGAHARSSSYGPKQFAREFRATDLAVRQVAAGAELAGSGFLGETKWDPYLGALFRSERHDHVRLVTIHRYPLNSCQGTTGRFRASISNLLAPTSVEGFFKSIATEARLARHTHERLRMTESNSVACGGKDGVSDSFASALWATDWMFLLAALRLDGVDFHMASGKYTPFTTFHIRGMHGSRVRPLYYAMLLFSEATAHRARILGSAFRSARGHGGKVHAWATYDGVDHAVRVVINNKSGKAGYAVIHVPGAHGHATLKRLSARSAAATTGVTWAGQAFASPSFDGKLVGTPRVQLPTLRAGSKFRVKMPKFGVALLTVPVRRR